MSAQEQHDFRQQTYDELQITELQLIRFNFIKSKIIKQAQNNCKLDSFIKQMQD